MSNHPDWEDDNFDDFIRRSVEDPQIPFNPGAWEAMEQKLDADAAAAGENSAGKKGGKGGRIAGLGIAVLLLSGLGWFVFSGKSMSSTGGEKMEVIQKADQYQPTENGNPEELVTNPEKLGEEVAREETNSQSPAARGEAVKKSPQPATEEKSRQVQERSKGINLPAGTVVRPASPTAAASESNKSRAQPAPGKKPMAAGKPKLTEKELLPEKAGQKAGQGDPSAGALIVLPVASKEQAGISGLKTLARENRKAFNAGEGAIEPLRKAGVEAAGAQEDARAGSLRFPEKKAWIPFLLAEPGWNLMPVVQKEASAEETVVVDSRANDGRFSVSLTFLPDFSGTAQEGSMKMGAGFGVHLEYSIWQRFSVVSGVTYSKKNYLTDNSFSPYGKFWDYRPDPDHIDASCGVIDIPLNLRFYALNGSRHRVFLSGGLSSYLMLSEDYTLVYTHGNWKDYTYEVRNKNQHLFAVYNLSAGYERNFAGHWAVQLEPFMKIPARGVGIGSVKLNSMGAFIHLKYKIK